MNLYSSLLEASTMYRKPISLYKCYKPHFSGGWVYHIRDLRFKLYLVKRLNELVFHVQQT